ncbi:MAG: 2-amino-4-hydroxy-6-hydroxymethyldihydropteridine diphosphokinase [Sulfuricurvum sp.]|jgi:2-amino-4-hydroxy-6-hydroxymethyldihydropteridine diphosphokinase|uniref:2-amino-4-hydroxy-6- hydroxymethyldihydropteridine diphosphokinase n=1 Tax=Sulfuricurvum sp. TaxID=2025608 RepID=UPI0025D7D5A9|nr:2-amino-4-hydroxy-6-hydroxymethyldihydropteridine diphosphokinase [Sulfuricurvum sp.]MCI4406803.1 2-amino-4-hydroxy-6-hydroxymethyldihydropteridine diphosphokinase [Sulfuricurvum sp.]
MALRRTLDNTHTIFIEPNFPKKLTPHRGFRYRVVLGVGGNIGDVRRRMNRLWVYLQRLSLLEVIQSGVILRNPPFGYTQQNDFENTVIEIATSLSPRALLRLIWRIEKRFGRRRSFANAPRTLDLDILFFEKRSIRTKELSIPHPHWHERVSVTLPLGSLARKGARRYYEDLDI